MSFPNKETRRKCWDARDTYWKCLDQAESAEQAATVCDRLRETFKTACPPQWVTHFDRKKDYLKFKDRMEKEGYEPINDSETTSN